MTRTNRKSILLLMMVSALSTFAIAQFDDVYFDPDTDGSYAYSASPESQDEAEYGSYDEYGYDDATYDQFNDYDYYYTSRIRRFNSPSVGFGFYSPYYVDLAYYDPFYDPFYSPGSSIYISFGGYQDYAYWRSWNRYRRWNSWGYYNPIWNSYAYSSWYTPSWGNTVVVNNFYGNGGYYGGGGFYTGGGYYGGGYGSAYCPPIGGGGYYGGYYGGNGTNGTNARPTNYYGPRQTGTTTSSPRGPTGRETRSVTPRSTPTDVTTGRDKTPVETGGVTRVPVTGATKSPQSAEARPTYSPSSRTDRKTSGPISESPAYRPKTDRASKWTEEGTRGPVNRTYAPTTRQTSPRSYGTDRSPQYDRPSRTYEPASRSSRTFDSGTRSTMSPSRSSTTTRSSSPRSSSPSPSRSSSPRRGN